MTETPAPTDDRTLPRTIQAVSLDGTPLHVTVTGEGPEVPLVLCDGLGCDGYAWKYLTPALSRHRAVVHFHYRGHGLSGAPPSLDRFTVDGLCDDLRAALDAAGVHRAVLLGHSLGAQVIFAFQRRHPERVAGLVPICATYGRVIDTFHDHPLSRRLFGFVQRLVEEHPERAASIWRRLDSTLLYRLSTAGEVNGRLVREEDFRPYFTHLARMDVRHFFALAADASRDDHLGRLAGIDVPTLIIAGERDTFTPAWLGEVMHRRIPGSELMIVPGGSHTAPIEMPELLILRLARFLAERIPHAPAEAAS